MNELPDEIAELFTKPMGFPNSATEQELFVYRGEDLSDRLGSSGTIVYMPEFDRSPDPRQHTKNQRQSRLVSNVSGPQQSRRSRAVARRSR
jgi:hypothetical protein